MSDDHCTCFDCTLWRYSEHLMAYHRELERQRIIKIYDDIAIRIKEMRI